MSQNVQHKFRAKGLDVHCLWPCSKKWPFTFTRLERTREALDELLAASGLQGGRDSAGDEGAEDAEGTKHAQHEHAQTRELLPSELPSDPASELQHSEPATDLETVAPNFAHTTVYRKKLKENPKKNPAHQAGQKLKCAYV